MAKFLSAHESASGIRARAPWAANLAEFEWARAEVFDAPDGPVLAREELIGMAPEQLGSVRLCLGSWVLLRVFEYPVDQLWQTGIRAEELASQPASASTAMLVWRREEEVRHRCLELREHEALALVGAELRFAELCEWAASQVEDCDAPALAAGWLERWTADGLLRGVDVP